MRWQRNISAGTGLAHDYTCPLTGQVCSRTVLCSELDKNCVGAKKSILGFPESSRPGQIETMEKFMEFQESVLRRS